MILNNVLLKRNLKSLTGNHTIAVVKTGEEYDTLKESLAHIISDVNALIQEGSITGDGQKVNLDFYLGGQGKLNSLL